MSSEIGLAQHSWYAASHAQQCQDFSSSLSHWTPFSHTRQCVGRERQSLHQGAQGHVKGMPRNAFDVKAVIILLLQQKPQISDSETPQTKVRSSLFGRDLRFLSGTYTTHVVPHSFRLGSVGIRYSPTVQKSFQSTHVPTCFFLHPFSSLLEKNAPPTEQYRKKHAVC